jgi:retinol dehydrogenase 12
LNKEGKTTVYKYHPFYSQLFLRAPKIHVIQFTHMQLKDKICLITGAHKPAAMLTAAELASRGALVVITAPDEASAQNSQSALLQKVPNAITDYFICNLSSFSSIRKFVAAFRKKYAALHLLINYNSIRQSRRDLSEDGIEKHFAVNHLAPFLLTNLLLPLIKASAPARIINVSNEAHRHAAIRFEDLEFEKHYSPVNSYGQSKLANILFTKKLSQKLKGTGVTANCLHDGPTPNGLLKRMPPFLAQLINFFNAKPEKGAQTAIYLATSGDLDKVSGEYFTGTQRKKPCTHALRQDIADKLWEISQQYVSIQS